MDLKNNTKLTMGRWDKIKFWIDDWCGHEILKNLFFRLLSICSNPDKRIEETVSTGMESCL